VTYSLSRLGRDALDVQEAISVLLHAGVRVVSISDGVDSASGMGATVLRIVVSVLSMIAELERETIRTRLLDGRRRADANNKVYASEPRYGRRVVDPRQGDLREDPHEVHAIEAIKGLHTEGHSYRMIAQLLDEMGIKPRRASTWNHVVVGRIATGRRQPKKSATARRIERATAEWLESRPGE
jgi:site-specific DNA recombinase